MRVAVLGAGLQGSCVALDLAESGIQVDLYDRSATAMTQASLQNEGKIHLGFVYANDRSLRTARTMVDGAATFGVLLERWLGEPMARLRVSKPFRYAVHRDSLVSSDEFEAYLRHAHDLVLDRISPEKYFGMEISRPPRRLSCSELDDYDTQHVNSVFETHEVSIDPRVLAVAVRKRVSSEPMITAMFETEVHGVLAGKRGVAVDFTNGSRGVSQQYDHVVNALWDGRLAIDFTAGLKPAQPWLLRMKHFLIVRSPGTSLPSTTIVLGPYGDVVDYGDGHFYLSWYPVGRQGISSDLELPLSMRELPNRTAPSVRSGIIAGLSSVIPQVARLPADDVSAAELAGGVIFAWGETDIDDVGSGLHNRFDTGPITVDRYHSVDTGKLTTAPMYARMVADRVRMGL